MSLELSDEEFDDSNFPTPVSSRVRGPLTPSIPKIPHFPLPDIAKDIRNDKLISDDNRFTPGRRNDQSPRRSSPLRREVSISEGSENDSVQNAAQNVQSADVIRESPKSDITGSPRIANTGKTPSGVIKADRETTPEIRKTGTTPEIRQTGTTPDYIIRSIKGTESMNVSTEANNEFTDDSSSSNDDVVLESLDRIAETRKSKRSVQPSPTRRKTPGKVVKPRLKRQNGYSAWDDSKWGKLTRLVALSVPQSVIINSEVVQKDLGCSKAELALRVRFLKSTRR